MWAKARAGWNPASGTINYNTFNMRSVFTKAINSHFFKAWDPEMAYILGFIAADGSISKRKDRKDSYLFNITNKDKRHLENIKNILLPSKKIGSKRSGYTGRKDNYYLQTTNREICKDLINLGIIPRKTYSFQLPNIPKKYFSDFARGFFDGDGTVYIYKVNDTLQIKAGFVSASLFFITEFNKCLCESINILPKAIHKVIPKIQGKVALYSTCYYIDDCEKLGQFMYQNNPSLYLPRKYQVFEKWKSIKRRKYIKQNYPSKVGWQLNQNLIA